MGLNALPPRSGAGGDLHALVLAGGFGRRLEGLTQRIFGRTLPKQFCNFGNRSSLLQQTLERFRTVASGDHVTVVVDRTQATLAAAQLRAFPGAVTIEQPCDRGTAAGVLLPLLDLLRRAPDARVVVTASDHGVADPAAFLATVDAARHAVEGEPDRIVLIGAEPVAPNTDYGWIVREGFHDGVAFADGVAHFVEKPSARVAGELFASGRAVWNTMVLVASARSLAECFALTLPTLARELPRRLALAGGVDRMLFEEYATLPSVSFSADVLGACEGLGVVMLPARAGWTDLGTEARLLEWLDHGGQRLERSELAETG